VSEVGHGGQCVAPYLLLVLTVGCGEAAGCVDDGVGAKQGVEGVDIAVIARGEPLLDDRRLLRGIHPAIVDQSGPWRSVQSARIHRHRRGGPPWSHQRRSTAVTSTAGRVLRHSSRHSPTGPSAPAMPSITVPSSGLAWW
jgi:hypothetical protein